VIEILKDELEISSAYFKKVKDDPDIFGSGPLHGIIGVTL
jgi:hypothetical protein